MTEKVILVTPPDDYLQDGLRILLVDLNVAQSQLVSDALNTINEFSTIIAYIWKAENSVDWLIDKKQKSQLIIFNADSDNHIVVGYMAAQKNSHYFGTLKSLGNVNNSAIYTTDQCGQLITDAIKKHE